MLGALEDEEMDGQEGPDLPALEGNTHRSDCNSGYLSSSATGKVKERVFPVIPHLVGSPFNTSTTSPPAIITTPTATSAAGGGAAGTGGTSTSPTAKSSNMRRLSVRLSERAIGLFGFLRGGSHHRSSASLVKTPSEVDLSGGTRQGSILSSYNMNSQSQHYDDERMPLDASSSRKLSHYLDFNLVEELSPSHPKRVLSDCSPASLDGCSASRSSKGLKGTSRASMAQSEDLDDLGTLTPFDPQSRHSSLYEINSIQQQAAMKSTHSMTLGIEQVQSPRQSVPSGTPLSSGHEIEIITDSDLIWDTPPAPHDRVAVAAHISEEEGHPVDDLNSHSPTNSSPPLSTSPSKQRKHNTRDGSVTSLTSIATTGSTSPEKYPYDKTAGWFNVGRSGFSKDREISIVTKGHLRLKDGTCACVQRIE